jgi:hypothetical protein
MVRPAARELIGRARNMRPAADESGSTPAKTGRPKMTVEEANKQAQALAKRLGKTFFGLSGRAQAKLIGCAWETWSKTSLFKEARKKGGHMPAGGRGRAKRSPPVVGLTDTLAAVMGEGDKDEVLKHLIAEQEADSEPSPLEDDPPSATRRVHSRKRL